MSKIFARKCSPGSDLAIGEFSRNNGHCSVTMPPIEILRPFFSLELLCLPTNAKTKIKIEFMHFGFLHRNYDTLHCGS